ncbi:MAG: hypothetical protein M3436_09630 [Pseudomonadota bacterium]|nr:hypothetical protein [Pseudomonadota bacterium]
MSRFRSLATPDPEVAEKAVRRKFTAEYKRSILEHPMPVGMKERSVRCYAGRGGSTRRRPNISNTKFFGKMSQSR